MNDKENSSTDRLNAAARELEVTQRAHGASRHFASYLHGFDNFLALLASESQWGLPPLLARCCGRFPEAQAHVAFV
jgi:hypothetical protein